MGGDLACRLADPFLVALIAVARWAAARPGASLTLTGPARVSPAAAVALLLLAMAVHRRRTGYSHRGPRHDRVRRGP